MEQQHISPAIKALQIWHRWYKFTTEWVVDVEDHGDGRFGIRSVTARGMRMSCVVNTQGALASR